MNENPINYNALKYLKLLIDPRNKILDLYVEGRWLWAELSSGVRLGVRNTDNGKSTP